MRHGMMVASATGLIAILGCGGGGPSGPGVCAPTVVPAAPLAPAADPNALVIWDVSGSMDRFANGGPLTTLNRELESNGLQSVGIVRFSHALLSDVSKPVTRLPQPLQLYGEWTNLPDVAEQLARTFADASTPTVSVLISDMKVETPPLLRNQPNATVCGDVNLPSRASAPFVFGSCFSRGLGPNPQVRDAYVAAIRVPVDNLALYVLVVSREAKLGRKVTQSLQHLLGDDAASSVVLVDLEANRQVASPGDCSYNADPDVPMLNRARSGTTPQCRFRFRDPSSTHALNCSLTVNPPGESVVGATVGRLLRGDQVVSYDASTRVYTLESDGMDATANQAVWVEPTPTLTAEAAARLSAFTGSGDAADTIQGLAQALKVLAPPPGDGWTVPYEGTRSAR